MGKLIFILYLTGFMCAFFVSCKTVDFEKVIEPEMQNIIEVYSDKEPIIEEKYILVEAPSVEYSEVQTTEDISKTFSAEEAVVKNYEDKKTEPEYIEGRLKAWLYKEDNVYEVYTQTYRSTLIEFEPGELILEVPYISEPDVWRISHGQGYKNGLKTEYLIVKPDYTNLISTLIVLTDRRVYQIELSSSNTQYMPTVRWAYRNDISNTFIPPGITANSSSNSSRGEFISFDYKMSHSVFDKPSWMPTSAYDDGEKTYIVLDEKSLLMEFPVLFNEKKEIINYRTNKNIIIIDQLIEKVTLKLGSDSVTIEKKKT